MKYGKIRVKPDFIKIIKKASFRDQLYLDMAKTNEVSFLTVVRWFETNSYLLTTKHNEEAIRQALQLEPGENIFHQFI